MKKNVLTWRIYYGDGSTYDNTLGTPLDAPPLDVQVIVYAHKTEGRKIIHLWDWCYWVGDEWWGSDLHGLLDQLLHTNNVTAVKQGRNVKNETYQELLKRAINDADFQLMASRGIKETPTQAWGDGEIN